jgi:putative oxidoreductase
MNNKKQWAYMMLRVIVGFGYMAHGWVKFSRGTAGFERLLTQTGVPFAHLFSWLVPGIELIGGLALVLGLFVAAVSIPLIMTMLVAMCIIQLSYGYSSVNTIGLSPDGPLFGPPGYEINLLYIAALVVLMANGDGKLSMSGLLFKRSANTRI